MERKEKEAEGDGGWLVEEMIIWIRRLGISKYPP